MSLFPVGNSLRGLSFVNNTNDIHNSPFVLEGNRKYTEVVNNRTIVLFEDNGFHPTASSIEGADRKKVKCRCNQEPRLSMVKNNGKNHGKAYFHCPLRRCNFFRWAFSAEQMQWYRFGLHNHHVLVADLGFRAEDLLQGKVGDCWFLSALAVIAERQDLIQQLFPKLELNHKGILEVYLFLDGWWRSILIDNFLPCMFEDAGKKTNEAIKKCVAEMEKAITKNQNHNSTQQNNGNAQQHSGNPHNGNLNSRNSSKFNPFALSDRNLDAITSTADYLSIKFTEETGRVKALDIPKALERRVNALDLSYSKANNYQCWVQFLEKAYAKAHGCYQAISGGEIAEAFLDLTGCPTLEFHFDKQDFDGRFFWSQLKSFYQQRLPMGCGTTGNMHLSEVGLVGNHAYSILEIREFKLRNPSTSFSRGNVLGFSSNDGFPSIDSSNNAAPKTKNLNFSTGNVSGFGEDGLVRLLKIRNPHGRTEWKGDWSDKSKKWNQLIGCDDIKPTGEHDGTFWMDYDNFLMGFSNVDVCLAFKDLFARSFNTSFPQKKSAVRCTSFFEVSFDEANCRSECVEIFVMAIQKTRRGAWSGRADRKKSYKQCDVGFIMVYPEDNDDSFDFADLQKSFRTDGKMLGLRRNGHFRFILKSDREPDRSLYSGNRVISTQDDIYSTQQNSPSNASSISIFTSTGPTKRMSSASKKQRTKRALVFPISFGHPAATDKELSFVVRFVASGAIKIQHRSTVPNLHVPIQKFCLQNLKKQILMDGAPHHRVFVCEKSGGTVFVYLVIDKTYNVVVPSGSHHVERGTPSSMGISNTNSTHPLTKTSAENDDPGLCFQIEAKVRGMSCRTVSGLLQHETVARTEKFRAAWRRFHEKFFGEKESRLLMVLVKSGQDWEIGPISCKRISPVEIPVQDKQTARSKVLSADPVSSSDVASSSAATPSSAVSSGAAVSSSSSSSSSSAKEASKPCTTRASRNRNTSEQASQNPEFQHQDKESKGKQGLSLLERLKRKREEKQQDTKAPKDVGLSSFIRTTMTDHKPLSSAPLVSTANELSTRANRPIGQSIMSASQFATRTDRFSTLASQFSTGAGQFSGKPSQFATVTNPKSVSFKTENTISSSINIEPVETNLTTSTATGIEGSIATTGPSPIIESEEMEKTIILEESEDDGIAKTIIISDSNSDSSSSDTSDNSSSRAEKAQKDPLADVPRSSKVMHTPRANTRNPRTNEGKAPPRPNNGSMLNGNSSMASSSDNTNHTPSFINSNAKSAFVKKKRNQMRGPFSDDDSDEVPTSARRMVSQNNRQSIFQNPFKEKKKVYKSPEDQKYHVYGIFMPTSAIYVSREDWLFADIGEGLNSRWSSSNLAANQAEQMELERALAISRGDSDIDQILEASRKEYENQMLQKAMDASIGIASSSSNPSVMPSSSTNFITTGGIFIADDPQVPFLDGDRMPFEVTNDEDVELQNAISLSLQQSLQGTPSIGVESLMQSSVPQILSQDDPDFKMAVEMSLKEQVESLGEENKPEVIELLDSSEEEPTASEPAEKRRRFIDTMTTGTPDTTRTIDVGDTCLIRSRVAEAIIMDSRTVNLDNNTVTGSNIEQTSSVPETGGFTADERRRRALEAAEKRMSRGV